MSERYEVVFVNSELPDLLPPALAAAYINSLLPSGPFQVYSSLTRSSIDVVALLSSPLQPNLLLAPVWNPKKQQGSIAKYGIPSTNEELVAIASRLIAGYFEIDYSTYEEDDATFENRVFTELVSGSNLRKIVVTVTSVIHTVLKCIGFPALQPPVILHCQINPSERTVQLLSSLQTAVDVQQILGGFSSKGASKPSAFPLLRIPEPTSLSALIKREVSKECADMRRQLAPAVLPFPDSGSASIQLALTSVDQHLESLTLRFSNAYESVQAQVNSVNAFKHERKEAISALLIELKSSQTRQRELLDLLKSAGEKATSGVETLKARIGEIEKRDQTLRQELAGVRVERKPKAFPIEIQQAGLNESHVLALQIKSRKCYDLSGSLSLWRDGVCVHQSQVLINIAKTEYTFGQPWEFPPAEYIVGIVYTDGSYMSNNFIFSIAEDTPRNVPPPEQNYSQSFNSKQWHQPVAPFDPEQMARTLPPNLQERVYPNTLVYKHTDNMADIEEELNMKFPPSRLSFFRTLAVSWVNENAAQLEDFINTVLDETLSDQQVIEVLTRIGFQFQFNATQ